ncbi:hypothetical protein OIDMADRAFT_143327 [Oidiodendron maius Zn]|uniref:Uncharacterized protein n=1 Tax=Oidiodendron maius (strain Zn) TaxID=913774 RepID=A0A0C3HLD0_OIDMZ|nr:hypothetical protein OIDMADRAFT_143327 [Oidiodendron maius Zn]
MGSGRCSLAPRDRAQVANALADVPAPSDMVSMDTYARRGCVSEGPLRRYFNGPFSFLFISFLLVAIVGEIRAASPSTSGTGHGGARPHSAIHSQRQRERDALVVVQSRAHLLLSALSSPSSGPPGQRPWIDAVMRNDVGDQPPMLSANLISGWPVLWLNLLRASPY